MNIASLLAGISVVAAAATIVLLIVVIRDLLHGRAGRALRLGIVLVVVVIIGVAAAIILGANPAYLGDILG